MFRFLCRSSPPGYCSGIAARRHFHRVTTDFSTGDREGKLVTTMVPVIVGDPGERYVLIEPEVGRALGAASKRHAPSPVTSIPDECKLVFFHDSNHFGVAQDSSSYPRLYVPKDMPRQTESNISPATLFLYGKMHEITLDERFARHANASARNLALVLDQLRDM